MTDRPLQDVLADVSAAEVNDRIPRWKNVVVGYGADAIEPVSQWLPKGSLGRFAIAVLEAIACDLDEPGRATKSANRNAVIQGLKNARGSVLPENRGLLDDALSRLGVGPPGPSVSPEPPTVRPERHWPVSTKVIVGPPSHVVIDHVNENPSEYADLYFVECGFTYGGEYARWKGGELEPAGRQVCEHCLQALERGDLGRIRHDGPLAASNEVRTWILRGSWHETSGTVRTPRLGNVYLTKCYRWITVADRDIHRVSLPPALEPCLDCQDYVDRESSRGSSATPPAE